MVETTAQLILSVGCNADRTKFIVKMEVKPVGGGDAMFESMDGPYMTEAEALARTEWFSQQFTKASTLRQGTMREEFMRIANSDMPPADAIQAMRDIVVDRMMADALYVRIGADPRFREEGADLLADEEFRAWTQRPGIAGALDTAIEELCDAMSQKEAKS